MPFKEHIAKLCLPIPMYLGSLKFQSENSYGKSFANLLIFLEGLKAKDLISDADYEIYQDQYNQPLTKRIKKTPEQFRKEQTREAYCKEQNRFFGLALKDYSYLRDKKPQNLKRFLDRARLPDNVNIKNAKLLLELAEQDRQKLEVTH